MTDFMEGGPFAPPPHPWAAPKKPILNRVKQMVNVLTFIATLLKDILVLKSYLLTQTVLRMKSNLKMFMNNLLSTNTCLILVTTRKIQRFLIRLTKKLLANWKMSWKINWWVSRIKVKDVLYEKYWWQRI